MSRTLALARQSAYCSPRAKVAAGALSEKAGGPGCLFDDGAHRANDRHGVAHIADSEDRNIAGGGANQFNRVDGSLGLVGIYID